MSAYCVINRKCASYKKVWKHQTGEWNSTNREEVLKSRTKKTGPCFSGSKRRFQKWRSTEQTARTWSTQSTN